MAKLVLSRGGAVVYQCFLDKGAITVGRDAHNHVVVDDPGVGGEHAQIVSVGNDHIIEDLSGVRGTLVNGHRVDRHILQHGDVVELGAFYLRYLNPRVSSVIDLERTMLIAGLQGAATRAHAGVGTDGEGARLSTARPNKIRFPRGTIRTLAGKRQGKVIHLDHVVTLVGERGDRLAVLTRRPHGYFVRHVEGRRYPRVNGQSIGTEARLLRSGDIVEVGDEKVEFVLR
jgi:pSer/pThr/pTyr-binding forkhead associated (FHA) protein